MTNLTKKLVKGFKNPADRLFLEAIKGFDQDEETTVEAILESLEEVDPDNWERGHVVQNLKWFEGLGLGRMIKGARGRPTRIRWKHSPLDIVKTALGEMELETSNIENPIEVNPRELNWTELLKLAAATQKISPSEVRVRMTISEAKKVLAESQGITIDEVSIKLG